MRSTILALVFGLSAPSLALAEGGKFKATHPRRAEVNERLKNENARIREGRENGTLNKEEAKELRSEVHGVREEERGMAAQHHGHITKAEQKSLNQQENQISKQIHEEKHETK